MTPFWQQNRNKYIFVNGSTAEVLIHTKSDRALCQIGKTKQVSSVSFVTKLLTSISQLIVQRNYHGGETHQSKHKFITRIHHQKCGMRIITAMQPSYRHAINTKRRGRVCPSDGILDPQKCSTNFDDWLTGKVYFTAVGRIELILPALAMYNVLSLSSIIPLKSWHVT